MKEFDNMIVPLKEAIDAIVVFIVSDELINFLKKIPNEKVFFFITRDLAPSILSRVCSMVQISAVFLIDGQLVENEPWVKQWTKIKDPLVILDFSSQEVQRKTYFRCDSVPTHIVSSTQLGLIPRSFMFTKFRKEIFVQMKDDDEQAKKDLIEHCRQRGDSVSCRIKVLKQFERDYRSEKAIYWYTRDCFFQPVVNEVLRSEKVTDIFMMRLLIRDIHRQIERLHQPLTETQLFYRGQCLPCADFEQLRLKAGGLYSFNSFLSTSTNYDVAYQYAESGRCTNNPVQVGVLFRIHIDPNACENTAFTSVANIGCYDDLEQEVLFTTHTIFHIGPIRQLGNQLWQVDLFSTTSRDEKLEVLTSSIQEATEVSVEWDRIGKYLLNLGFCYDMAKEVLDLLIANSKKGSSHRHHLMGLKEFSSGNCQEALDLFKTALQAYPDNSNLDYSHMGRIHFDTGSVYQQSGNYTSALKSYRSAFNFQKQWFPINHAALLGIHIKMARIYTITERYLLALKMHQEILKIRENFIPTNELQLADTYRNIGKMYYHMSKYPQSLGALQKVASLRQSCVREDDLKSQALACIMGVSVEKTREPEKSLESDQKLLSCEKELEHLRTKEPDNHNALAIQYDLMGHIYRRMKDYSRALESYYRLLDLSQRFGYLLKTDMASTLNTIGEIHERMQNREEAYLRYEEAISIEQKSCRPNMGRLQLYRKHLHRVTNNTPQFFDDEFYGSGC